MADVVRISDFPEIGEQERLLADLSQRFNGLSAESTDEELAAFERDLARLRQLNERVVVRVEHRRLRER